MVSKVTRSKEACDILEDYHDGSEKVKLQSLTRKFELMLIEEDQRVSDYLSKLFAVVNQMKACGYNLYDKQVVDKVIVTPILNFLEHLDGC